MYIIKVFTKYEYSNANLKEEATYIRELST